MAYELGTIIAWENATIPEKWALCNGENGTPDLRDKFIRGASNDTECNTTDGELSHEHEYPSPSTSGDGEHSHGAHPSVGSSGTSTKSPLGTNKYWSGNHTHSVSAGLGTESDHTHTIQDTEPASNLPVHIVLKFIMKVEE
jgi:hypothetical protein